MDYIEIKGYKSIRDARVKLKPINILIGSNGSGKGLHPFAISKLAGMIQSAASKEAQVIVATQSADLVNHFTADDIITVDQREGESHFKRLEENDLNQWLGEYSIGDLWQRNIIHGGQPK